MARSIEKCKISCKTLEIIQVYDKKPFWPVFVGRKGKKLSGSTFKCVNLLSLRYLSFKHNRGHSWVMLPITVDFLFDGRNTGFWNKAIAICMEEKTSKPSTSGKRLWWIEYTRIL